MHISSAEELDKAAV